jgi:hypothetical protein
MQVLKVEKVVMQGPMPVLFGVVENEKIVVGQSVVAVSSGGARDSAMITGVMPDSPGSKEFDEGSPGKAVKVVLRRRNPAFPNEDIVALEKAPA